MGSLQDAMMEYRKQLEKGTIREAYRGLMQYMMALRTHLRAKYPDDIVSGSVYSGYMDMTYFSFFPESLKRRNLKVAIVFVHEAFRFEAWLAGYNKPVQAEYWELFKASGWDRYHIVPTTKGADAILDYVLVADPDFDEPGALTEQIEKGTLRFIEDIESFLSAHEAR